MISLNKDQLCIFSRKTADPHGFFLFATCILRLIRRKDLHFVLYNTMNSSFVLQASSEGPVYAQFADTKAAPTANSALEHRGFSPYDFNGGTVAAIAGPDYCVVACDTRLSSGYEILSRNVSKIHSFGSGVLASSGSKNDVDQLRSWMDIKLKVSGLEVAAAWFGNSKRKSHVL